MAFSVSNLLKPNPHKISLSLDQKIFLCSNLSYCLHSGISLSAAIGILLSFEDIKPNQKLFLQGVQAGLSEGKSFSKVTQDYPKAFDTSAVALIASAEESGKLDEILTTMSKDFARTKKLVSEVKQALTYPSIVLFSMGGISIMMIVVVIPKVAQMYSRMQIEMPVYTAFILNGGVFISEHLIPIAVGFITFSFVLFFSLIKIDKVNTMFKNIVTGMPIVKSIFSNYDLTHFCRSVSLLYTNGVPILRTIDLSSASLIRPVFRKALGQVTQSLEKGGSFKESFAATKVFPSIFIQLVGVGEQSATLDQTFSNLGDYFDDKVTEAIKRFAGMLEPLLMVFLGLMVGGLIFSIITPVYQMVGGMA